MLDMIADFKELGLHGMASAWFEVAPEKWSS